MTPPPGARFVTSADALAAALDDQVPRPAAVVGVGSALRGDDGLGPAVVAALKARQAPFAALVDAGPAPENVLGAVLRAGPAGVVFVDAADLGADPGTVALVPAEAFGAIDVSTHAVSLGMLASALGALATASGGAAPAAALVGAQPASLETPDRLSPPARAAAALVADALDCFARGGAQAAGG